MDSLHSLLSSQCPHTMEFVRYPKPSITHMGTLPGFSHPHSHMRSLPTFINGQLSDFLYLSIFDFKDKLLEK